MKLALVPISFDEASAFVTCHHRHHLPAQGHKFSIAVTWGEQIAGVVMVGRPVGRLADDGFTLEVTRCATDGTPNACSKLYRAAWRACIALGYRKLITYTLPTEPGTSLRAGGFRLLGEVRGGSWNRSGRPRVDKAPTQGKLKWEMAGA